MKRAVPTILCLVLVLFVFAVVCASAAPASKPTPTGKPIVLKFTSSRADTMTYNVGSKWFIEEVKKRSGGRVDFQTFWGGALSKQGEELDAIGGKLAESGTVAIVDYPAKLPLLNITYSVPFGPADPAVSVGAVETLSNEFPAVKGEMERYNVKVLTWLCGTSYQVSSKKPVKTLGDFKGLKVATVGQFLSKVFSSTGATSVTMAASDRYMALQTGVIDAQSMSWPFINSMRVYEVSKHLVQADLGSNISCAVVINKDVWNGLPADIQKIMVDAGKDTTQHMIKYVKDDDSTALRKMTAAGSEHFVLPLDERSKWALLLPNLPGQWAEQMEAKGLPGRMIMKRFLTLSKERGAVFPRDWQIDK